MLPETLCFVDVETTGMRPTWDRVIEIGMIRVEGGQVVETFESLVNPGGNLPPEITLITGITGAQLQSAPSFWEIKSEIEKMLAGATFVAHNVRFDYSFLKNEFKRLGTSFNPKHFCTAKLSRYLYPRFARHSVDALIERFGFEVANRHRALSDTQVIWDFYQQAQRDHDVVKFTAAVNRALKKPSVPLKLAQADFDTLPETPGVYIFYGDNKSPLYIGKSVNIRDRVLSHFSADHLSGKEMKISQQIRNIETIQTSGELGALILESELIKKMQPLYNRMLRYSQGMIVLTEVEKKGYRTVAFDTLDHIDPGNLDKILGVFKSKKALKDHLAVLAKDYSLCSLLLGVEGTLSSCFGYRLGTCFGACVGKELPLKYNLRFVEAFTPHKLKNWPFDGPVVITEKNDLEDTQESFIIDKWCLLGKVRESWADNFDDYRQLVSSVEFDLDTYKIIYSYINNPKNQKNICNLSSYINQPSIMAAE